MRTVLSLVLLAGLALPASAAPANSADNVNMARQINQHLQQSGQLRNYRIGASYRNGIALLEGTVASAEQRDTAVRLAEQVAGVARVECRLTYPGEGQSTSAEAPRDLSLAFADTNEPAHHAEPGIVQAQGSFQQAARAPMLSRTSIPQQSMRPAPRSNMPRPMTNPAIQQASAQMVQPAGGACPPGAYGGPMGPAMGQGGMGMQPMPAGFVPHAHGRGPSYEGAQMPGYAWPSYASYPNYAALTYPQQYSPTAWPYIGPFYPYPQVPLAWRKVSLEWDDGWWFLDFSAHNSSH